MVLLSVILMDLLAGMEFDLFVPSFPELQHYFGLTPFWVEALLSANFAGYCLSLFFVGGLADRYGRKPIIMLGLSTFVFGSILCLITHSYYFLLAGRFFQGIGVAAPAILSFLIIADSYPLKKQQFLMAMLNGAMNVAAAIAPVIGSFVTLHFTWLGNFVALLLLGSVTLLTTLLFIPSYTLPHQRQSFSLRGYLPIFRSKPLMLLIINLVFTFVPYWVFVGMSPLLYIKSLGVSLPQFGYYQGALALAFAIGSVIYGLILQETNYSQKKMLTVTNIIFIFSLVTIAWVTFVDSSSPLLITLAFLPFIIGQVIPSTILYPAVLNFLPEAKGRASAVMQGGRLILTAISLQIAGLLYVGTFRNIGIILIILIAIASGTLFFVTNNRRQKNTDSEPL